MPFLETEARRETLFYSQCGQPDAAGLKLVFLHGAGGVHLHWGRQLQALSDMGRMIALDLPGHGRSAGPGCQSVSDYSKVLVAVLDALQLDRVVLVGHSMGGAIALWTTLVAPRRVQCLALVSTGTRLPVLPALFEHLERGEHAAAAHLIMQLAYGSSVSQEQREKYEAVLMQVNPDVLYGDLLACAGYHIAGPMDTISCPVAVVCGNEDRVTPLKFSQSLHEQVAGSSLHVLEGAGHMTLIEQPDAVTAILRQFISRCKSG